MECQRHFPLRRLRVVQHGVGISSNPWNTDARRIFLALGALSASVHHRARRQIVSVSKPTNGETARSGKLMTIALAVQFSSRNRTANGPGVERISLGVLIARI